MAMNLNHVVIIGRLGKDPELKQTSKGTPVVDFSIANNRDYGNNERVNWINCRAYKGTAETICKYLSKGRKVLLQGEMTEDHWEKDGKFNSRTYLLVTSFEFIDGKAAESGESSGKSSKELYTNEVYESYDAYDPDEEF